MSKKSKRWTDSWFFEVVPKHVLEQEQREQEEEQTRGGKD